MRNIIFDLDGTLINISERYYVAHLRAAKLSKINPLSKEEYWDKKRGKITEAKILNKNRNSLTFKWYESFRINFLESKDILKLDKLFFWVHPLLQSLMKKNNLYLITLRRNREQLIQELKNFKILSYFKNIFSDSAKDNPTLVKLTLAKQILAIDESDLLIGDTEVDIDTAKALGINSVAVCSGIRTKDILSKNNPTFLVKNAYEFFKKEQ